MTTRQTSFGLATGISTVFLGAMLSSLDPAGWHLLFVGAGISTLTLTNTVLGLRALSPAAIQGQVN